MSKQISFSVKGPDEATFDALDFIHDQMVSLGTTATKADLIIKAVDAYLEQFEGLEDTVAFQNWRATLKARKYGTKKKRPLKRRAAGTARALTLRFSATNLWLWERIQEITQIKCDKGWPTDPETETLALLRSGFLSSPHGEFLRKLLADKKESES